MKFKIEAIRRFIFPNMRITFERWKWNEKYQVYVSTLGNFRNEKKEKIKPFKGSKGYFKILVNKKTLLKSAHRVVMETWCPCPGMDELTVDHLSGNKMDNSLTNLEWVTEKENQLRAATMSKGKVGNLALMINNFLEGKISVIVPGSSIVLTKDNFIEYFHKQNGMDFGAKTERVAKKLIEACLTKKSYQGKRWRIKGED